jgi:aminopeptidase N
LPSFDDTREKLVFTLTYSFNEDYTIVSNGLLEENIKINDSTSQWLFTMKDPMSSYLVAMAAGKYESEKFTTTSSGVPVELYFVEKDRKKHPGPINIPWKYLTFLKRKLE